MSYLYVIAPVNGIGPSKIGVSKSPDKRVKTLQTGYPQRLIVHYREEIGNDIVWLYEGIIKRDLRHLKVMGEWYKLDAKDAQLHVQWTLIHYEPITDLRRKFRLRRV